MRRSPTSFGELVDLFNGDAALPARPAVRLTGRRTLPTGYGRAQQCPHRLQCEFGRLC